MASADTTTSTTKRTAIAFGKLLSDLNFIELRDTLSTPTATWIVLGSPNYNPLAGSHLVYDWLTQTDEIFGRFTDPRDFIVHSVIAEGGRAVVEAEVRAGHGEGKAVRNLSAVFEGIANVFVLLGVDV
jgi:hypothetical protein